jgi:hypothetical protein
MELGKIAILVLTAISSFVAGILYSDLFAWEKFIGPLAISLSALLATSLAVRNINQGRRQETIRRTLEILDKKPIQDNESIGSPIRILRSIGKANSFDFFSQIYQS